MVKKTAGVTAGKKMVTTFILHQINEGGRECSRKNAWGTESGGSGENSR